MPRLRIRDVTVAVPSGKMRARWVCGLLQGGGGGWWLGGQRGPKLHKIAGWSISGRSVVAMGRTSTCGMAAASLGPPHGARCVLRPWPTPRRSSPPWSPRRGRDLDMLQWLNGPYDRPSRLDSAAATTIVAALAPAGEATMEHGRHHHRTRPFQAPWYGPRRRPISPAPTPIDLVEGLAPSGHLPPLTWATMT